MPPVLETCVRDETISSLSEATSWKDIYTTISDETNAHQERVTQHIRATYVLSNDSGGLIRS